MTTLHACGQIATHYRYAIREATGERYRTYTCDEHANTSDGDIKIANAPINIKCSMGVR